MSNNQFHLKNNYIFIVAQAAGGVYNSTQLKAICEISDTHSAFLKITEDERIGFMVDPSLLPNIEEKLKKVGVLVRHYRQGGGLMSKACLGEICPKSQQDALGHSIELSELLEAKLKDTPVRFSLGFNGCEEACSASALDDIHLVGEPHGYKIYVGGKSSEIPILSQRVSDGIPQEKIGEALLALLDVYLLRVQEGESWSSVVERLGTGPFMEACAPFEAKADQGELGDDLSAEEMQISPPEESLLSSDLPDEESLQSDELMGADGGDTLLVEDPTPVEEGLELPPAFDSEEPLLLDDPQPVDGLNELPAVEELNELPVVDEPNDPPAFSQEESFLPDDLEIGREAPLPEKHKKISIRIVGNNFAVVLPNGSEFHLPYDSLPENQVLEMQLDDEKFLVEHGGEKLKVKYGSLEMNIPLPGKLIPEFG